MASTPTVRVGVGVFVLSSSSTTTKPSFLMGQRISSHGSGTFALPGGHLEFGETFEECAAREVLEETGLRVKDVRFLTATNDVMKEDGKHYVTCFMFCVRDDEGIEPQCLEKDKCAGWGWVEWETLVSWVEDESKGGERKVFIPLVNLVKQRPGMELSFL